MTNHISLPEGLSLVLDDSRKLHIEDAQGVTHIDFSLGAGDPCGWSMSIAMLTCAALGIDGGYDYGTEEDVSVELLVARWHERNGADEGFLP